MKHLRAGILVAMMALLILVGAQSRVEADPYLELTLSTTSGALVTIFSDTGSLAFNGPVGANYDINIVGGVSYPGIGTQFSPDLDLVSLNTNNGARDTLTITLSVINFLGPVGSPTAHLTVGGTMDGNVNSLVFNDYFDPSNKFFQDPTSTPVLIATLGPFSHTEPAAATPFSGVDDTSFTNFVVPYSLTLQSVLDSTGRANVSYDSELEISKVPEPISLILLGGGLAGVGLYRRLRKPRG